MTAELSDNYAVIHRVSIPIVDVQTVDCFPGEILSVAPTRDGRRDRIDLWFTRYKTASPREVFVVGTGQPYSRGRFVGTVVTPAGLVWHVFERYSPEI